MTMAVSLTKGTYTIHVEAESVEEDIANKLLKISVPQAEGRQGIESPKTVLYDFKRFMHMFTVSGYLSAQSATIAGASTRISAHDAKWYLIKFILHTSGDIVFTWRNSASETNKTYNSTTPGASTATYNVAVDKFKVGYNAKRAPPIKTGTPSSDADMYHHGEYGRYRLDMTLTKGAD